MKPFFNSRPYTASLAAFYLLSQACLFAESGPPRTCGSTNGAPEDGCDTCCGTPDDKGDTGDGESGGTGGGTGSGGSGSGTGPNPKGVSSAIGRVPGTTQSFVTPDASNGRNSAVDLEIHQAVGAMPLQLRRQYQSRSRTGTGDVMGHGLTWTHSYSWTMWYSGSNKRTVVFPGGNQYEFSSQSGTVTFEGSPATLHKTSNGRGERIYQTGPGENTFILLMQDGTRQVFERVTIPEGTLYHPRYAEDVGGRRQTYTTDAKARITSVSDSQGNGLGLEYGSVQVNRLASIPLKTITSTPSTGWNEFVISDPTPHRWIQCLSAKGAYFSIAEIEFYGPDGNGGEVKLAGTVYGTGPAKFGFSSSTFEKAFDGNEATSFLYARPSSGVSGIDLGAGNESIITKIRFKPRTGSGAASMSSLRGTRFEAVTETPEIIEVLQRVTSTDGREVNYLYDTVVDESIGQTHLVLSGVDYDKDGLATSATDARFTYSFTNEGRGPSVETFHEPRTKSGVPDLKFTYADASVGTRGMVEKVFEATSNEKILDFLAYNTRQVIMPGNRTVKVEYNSDGSYKKVTDANGDVTSYTWAGGYLASKTDPAGRVTTYTFNFRGLRTSITRPEGLTETSTYDADGINLLSTTLSAPGFPDRTTTWTRDAESRVTRTDFADGSFVTYTYNAQGLVTQKRERNGSLTATSYDASGLMLTRTMASGTPLAETTTYTYYGNNDPTGSPARLLKSVSDPRNRTTTYEYNLRGQRTKTTYPDVSSRSYTYDSAGDKISETDGTATQSWTYNGFKKVTSMTDPLGHFTQYYYGDGGIACGCYNGGGPTMIVSAEGRLTLREYDKEWRLKKETIGHTTPEAATTEYLYDPFGNTISVSKPGNRTSTMTYDVMDRTATMTDALGTTMSYTYDNADNKIAMTEDLGGPLAKTTTMAYDLLNRPVLTTNPDATTKSRTYHPGGDTASVTDELGRTASNDTVLTTWTDSKGQNWTSFVSTTVDPLSQISSNHPAPMATFGGTTMSVSAMGRISENHMNPDGTTAQSIIGLTAAGSTVTQDPTVTTYTYDDDHLTLNQSTLLTSNSALLTSFTYDARGNRLTSKDPLNRITKTTYDLRSNPVETELPDGRKHTAVFDALNRRVSTTDPKNQTITYTFLQETNQTLALKDAKNQVTTWTYNALDQILTKAYPNGDTHTYTYDSLHRMATHRTPKLETCTYTYDLRDRQLTSDWNTTTPDTTKTYFANGLLKSIDNGISKSDYVYSVRNELTAETQTLSGGGLNPPSQVTYTYDADGLRQQMTSPAGAPIAYNWTAKTQLKDISRDGPPPLATYGYDAAGRLLTTAHENGITEVKTYNAASELLSILHSSGGFLPNQHAYTYDSTGRRTAETRTGILPATNTYGYDTADQVTSADYGNSLTDAYAYDPMGNRTTARSAAVSATPITYTTNSANQYTSISNLAPPVHNANGNLTSQGGVTYTWDSENRLLSTTDGTTTNTFTYDANHRRVTKRTAVNGTVTEKTHFIYDGWNVIEERNNTDTTPGFNLNTFTLSKELTWGTDLSGSLQGAGGVGGLLLITDHSAPGTYYYHYDGKGNVTQVTTNTGSTAATYRYDAFGNTLQATGTYAQSNKYRFSTKPIDAEISTAPLYYYGYRYYDPTTGRWLSRDPIGENGGVNLYGFVGNDGVNEWDLLGLKRFCCDGKWRNTGGRAGVKGCCGGSGKLNEGGRVYGKGQQCCGGTITGRLKDQCCVNGQVKNRIPLHEYLGLSLGECVGRFTLHPFESFGLGSSSFAAGFFGGSVAYGGAVAGGLLLLDQGEAILHCKRKVCPDK